ncbi:MAG: hypothetical protein FWG84_09105 [Bacteroidales bacterium]|nr:hypothetical protein [Bacteroidales bacterium]
MSDTPSELEVVKYKFNQLVQFGENFGETLIKGNKTKKKAISASLNTPFDYSDTAKAQRQLDDSGSKENMKAFVRQVFEHYDVNPSIETSNKKIIDTYVNENLDVILYLKKDNPDVVNEDNKLYDKIIELKNRGKIPPEERKMFITSIRGAGKTSYFNYFMSKYETDLNNNKIISIRINVMRISPTDLSKSALENAIKFQLCRILFTYYCTYQKYGDERLEGRDIKNYMNTYLDSIVKNRNYNYSKNDIEECSDFFKQYNGTGPAEISMEYAKLCELFLHLVQKDYKFVVMLDNFDQISPKYEEVYKNRMSGLQDISTASFFNHSIFIIAIRYNTFNSLPSGIRSESKLYVLGTPTTFDMINKRIDYYAAISESELKEKKINCLKNLIILIGNSFMPDFDSTKQIMNFEQACGLFDDVFYCNKRIIVCMINRFINIIPKDDFELLCEENFDSIYTQINDKVIDKFISKTYYKFLESLLVNPATGYCYCFSKYKTENDKYQFDDIKIKEHFDENFLPNIYRFPSIPHERTVQFIPFLKIRILQLLKNLKKKDYKFNQNQTATKLAEIFDYKKDAVHLACEELHWDQSIIIIEEEPEGTPENKEKLKEKKIDITPRGEKMLEILPININLLAVSLEQVFLPVLLLQTGMPIGNYNDADISKFIIRNIFYSLPKTIGLLNSIEQYEKEKVLSRATKTDQEHFNDSDFKITEKLKEIANNSIDRIYRSYFGGEHDSDPKFIRRKEDLKKQLEIAV